jgi:hypothetical protein
MATGSAVARAARAIKNANTTNTAWMTRSGVLTVHMGTLTRVDPFNGVADFQFPDPSVPIVQSVSYIQPYSSTNSPSVGDVVIAHQFGNGFMIMGQHIVLNGLVSM